MEEKAYIALKIEGKKNGNNLRPDLIDISEIREIFGDVEALLSLQARTRKEQIISYQIEEGSVVHKFFVPLVFAMYLQSIIDQLNNQKELDFLEKKQAEVLEKYQMKSKEEDLHFSFITSQRNSQPLKIHKNTNFKKQEIVWVDTEQYIYGEIFNVGGKEKYNIHINTVDFGTLIIKVDKEQARKAGELLYQPTALFISAKQNLETGEMIDIELISFQDFTSQYDEVELNKIIERVSPQWEGIIIDEWLSEIRGEEL